MICPACSYDNLPGVELCVRCLQDLTQLDQPMASNRVERSVMEDPVQCLKPRKPLTVEPTVSVREAIQTMAGHDIGAVLVVDAAGGLVGIFSERDLLTRVKGDMDQALTHPVEQYMTPGPESVTSADTLAFALHKMDIGGYRHLPVLEGGRPVGMISVRDMLRHITKLCKAT